MHTVASTTARRRQCSTEATVGKAADCRYQVALWTTQHSACSAILVLLFSASLPPHEARVQPIRSLCDPGLCVADKVALLPSENLRVLKFQIRLLSRRQ